MEKFVNIILNIVVGAATVSVSAGFMLLITYLISCLGLKTAILATLILICYLVGSIINKKL